MKKTLAAAAAAVVAASLAPAAQAQAVRFGVMGGITGPIASLAPAIIDASRIAFDIVNEQGGLLDGRTIEAVIGDSGCNPQLGQDAASKLVNIDRVAAIVGAHCSGATLAAANTVTIPAGVVLISPASTAPALTKLEDNDTVFRVVPSDSFQGAALARTLLSMGYETVAVTHLNNDYGKGLAAAFAEEFAAQGGTVAALAAHEEGKASYRAELAELARSGADTLAVFDYADGSGLTILREALENDFFERFVGGDGMRGASLIGELGAENLANFVVSAPSGTGGEARDIFNALFAAAGGDPNGTYVSTGFDAGFLLALAFEHAGGDPAKLSASLRAVASAPGEPILPGQWAEAKAAIAAGREIDYQGASGDLDFDMHGDVPGAFALYKVEGDGFAVITQMK